MTIISSDKKHYAKKTTKEIIVLFDDCIPNKNVRRVQLTHLELLQQLKDKKGYVKGIQKGQTLKYTHKVGKVRHLRNKVTEMVRNSKKLYTNNLANELKLVLLPSKTGGQLYNLLYFLLFLYIPSLEQEDCAYTYDQDEAIFLITSLDIRHCWTMKIQTFLKFLYYQ